MTTEQSKLADEFEGEAKAHRAMGDKEEARKCELAAAALRASPAVLEPVTVERCAKVADSFTCGGCGMDGKAAAAIRALIGQPSSRVSSTDRALHPLAEIREWDEALAELGIQDSATTPAEAVRELKAEIDAKALLLRRCRMFVELSSDIGDDDDIESAKALLADLGPVTQTERVQP